MKFTVPCFVLVEDAYMRKELIKWLWDIGYGCTFWANPNYHIVWCHFITDNYDFAPAKAEVIDRLVSLGVQNCGTDIELFKALAAMNDENDREQWFTDGTRWYLCQSKKVHPDYTALGYHKSTAEEILEKHKYSVAAK